MVTKAVCVRRNDLELEDYYDEICVDYDVEEPKLILEAYDTAPFLRGMRWPAMVDTQYKEIIEYLKEAQLDLENAEDSIKERIKKIRAYLDENPDEEQFNELEFLESRLEDIEEIVEEIENIILDLQDP